MSLRQRFRLLKEGFRAGMLSSPFVRNGIRTYRIGHPSPIKAIDIVDQFLYLHTVSEPKNRKEGKRKGLTEPPF